MKPTRIPDPMDDIFGLIHRYDRTARLYWTKFEAQIELADAYTKRGDHRLAEQHTGLSVAYAAQSLAYETVACDIAALFGITRTVREV